MIYNAWYVVLESKEVRDRPVGVTRFSEKLVFYRDQKGQVHCLKDQCVHRGVQLSLGHVHENHLICPFHGFEYNSSGQVEVIPAYGRNYEVPERYKVSYYKTHETHDFIYVFWGEPEKAKTHPVFFDDLEGFTYGASNEIWPVHYSRAIENQLDVVHLPFVHASTIGRGEKYVVDGPIVEWVDEDKFEFFVYNRVEDGSIAKKPDQMPKPNRATDFRLGFKFPNLWQNYIDDRIRVMAAFVPIDEHHTRIYLRFYQSFMKLPVMSHLINGLAMIYNRKVLHQDRRVVITQVPDKSQLKMSDVLIQGDLPILIYRKRRDELLKLTDTENIK